VTLLVADVAEVAAELYALPPDQFVAARDGRAAQARKAGDRALAAEVKKLRRPTVGAWLVNLLVRERPSELNELITLGSALRDAQAQLDAGQLRSLAQQRHQLVSALVEQATAVAGDRGQAPGDGARREAEETLEAALADPDAADALRSGRLTVALRYAGFGSVDLTDAVAAAGAVPMAPPARVAKATRKESDAERGRRERRDAAEQELQEARAAVAAAERAVEDRRRAAAQAAATSAQRAAEMADVERRLAELRAQHDEAVGAARAADAELAAAEHAARAARDREGRAGAAADRLDR
jgi:hypothetical protein